ncbi:MAG: chorismate mutase [Alphaproteobacteria bacterium]|nr:chorismate mutase [Alphaproteobacteria bacterium]
MKKLLPTLPELRAQIDAIDDQLHSLLRHRADIVHTVRAVKGKQPIFIRPGREATMLRVLLKRPAGRIPPGLIMRLWREMIGAFTMQEGRLSVAVTAGNGQQDLWDITRDYYGFSTPLVPCATAAQALTKLKTKATEVASLPLPEAKSAKPWWAALAKAPDLQVFAQFPFDLADATRSNGRGNQKGAWAVARLAPEPTSNDHGLLLVWGVTKRQSGAVREALQDLRPVALHHDSVRSCWLVTLDGLLDPAQKRYTNLQKTMVKLGAKCRIAGGYAVPLGF